MADLSITAASVLPSAGAVLKTGRAGAAIVAGDVVFLERASKTYKLADADHATQEIQEAVGIAVNSAAAGQPVTVCEAGDITLGAVLTAGSRYYLSSTPGKIQPEADLSSGEEINLLGLAKSTSVLSLRITRPGVTL